MRSLARAARLAIGAAAIIGCLPLGARAQTDPTVLELRLSGVVDPVIANYIEGGIDAANDAGDAAVLLTIDTPGGLDSSMRQIIQAILGSKVPVVCYVSPSGARAASAGTFIMMGCPVAAMAPGTNIGAAHPVGVAGAIEEQKVTNDAAAYIASLARSHRRNVEWARSAVIDSVSISAEHALQIGVIDLIEPNTPALLEAIDGRVVDVAGGATATIDTAGATVETRSPGLGAQVLHALLSPNFAFIFFYLGIGLIVIEFLHPGLSVPGILGVVCLIAAFVTFGLLPVQIIGVVLLLASAASFLLELKHPGLGAASVVGVATLVLGGLTLFNPDVPNARVSLWTILPVAGFLLLFFATIVNVALKARRLPRTDDRLRLVGETGIAERDLDPAGVVRVASEEWSARSAAGPISRGTRIRVLKMDGLRLVVEPTGEQAPAAPEPARGNATTNATRTATGNAARTAKGNEGGTA
ncbi:MAG TPA: nodulation protein NfeD [Actinomycetota bacterium]|jgi:membrane-bound serine protease (ClpP class)